MGDEKGLVGIAVRRCVFVDEGDRVKAEIESNVEIVISYFSFSSSLE